MQMLKGFIIGVVATVIVVTAWISYGDGMGHLLFTTSITAGWTALVCALVAGYKFVFATDRTEQLWMKVFGILITFSIVMFLTSTLYTH